MEQHSSVLGTIQMDFFPNFTVGGTCTCFIHCGPVRRKGPYGEKWAFGSDPEFRVHLPLLVGNFANQRPTKAPKMDYVEKEKQKYQTMEESHGPICRLRTEM